MVNQFRHTVVRGPKRSRHAFQIIPGTFMERNALREVCRALLVLEPCSSQDQLEP